MDSKDIKDALKSARESIRSKDFKTALKHCKAVLKADKDNYNALVFIGVAAKELDQPSQAVMAFERAIALAPEQILAWQGLYSFYEKSNDPEHGKELLRVLEKLIHLCENDVDKQFSLYEKYAELLLRNGDVQKCIEVLEKQLEVANGKEERQIQVHTAVLKAFIKHPSLPLRFLHLIEESLAKCKNHDDDEEKKNWFRHYLSLLKRNNLLTKAAEGSWTMYDLFPDCHDTLEFFCEIQLENLLVNKPISIERELLVANKFLEGNPNSNVAKMLVIACAFQNKQWQKMVDTLNLDVTVENVNDCQLIIKCYQILHQYQDIMKLAEKGFQMCELLNDSHELEASFQLYLSSARYHFLGKETAAEDVKTLEKIIKTDISDPDAIILLLLYYLKMEDVEAAKNILNNFSNKFHPSEIKGYQGLISKIEGNFNIAQNQLLEAVADFPNNITFILELALIYRELNDFKNSLLQLQMGVKQDCYNPKLFFEIGNHYKLLNRLKHAQRCYYQAFSLCPSNEEIGMALSDVYQELDEKEENLKLLTEITKKNESEKCKWAFVRIGLYHLKYDDATAAIKGFLSALRIDPFDCYCWEALADAYMTRGSYNAAYKSYNKVLELNPDNVYCSFQMANIKHLVQEYAEAAACYNAVLDKYPDYVPALKGCSEVYLHQCKEYLQQYLHGLAKDCCMKAIYMLEKSLHIRSDLVCLWKLLGDACTLAFSLPFHLSAFSVPSKLAPVEMETELCLLSKEELLQLGARCYGKALALLPDCSGLWHDIGVNYYYQSQDTTLPKLMLEKAILSLKKAVRLEPKDLMHWNTLGVVAVAVKNYALAQHCFIKAVNNDRTDPVPWTNLGILYLLNEQLEMANQAFSVAQSVDPSYLNSWIGQATIAESVESSDTMDLFRHAVDVGNHDEAEIGYSHWVIKTILKSDDRETELYKFWVENMAAIPTACDCMAKFTDRNENDLQGLNMYGLLLEKEYLFNPSLVAFEKSIKILENNNECGNEKDQIYNNYARLLCLQGYYDKSCTYYEKIKEPDLSSQCGLALAQFKAKRYKDSYESYDAAFHWFAKKDEDKSHILIAMAIVAHKQGDIENAKTLLFQSSQLKPISIHGILALCALGILHHENEIALAFAALRELLIYRHDIKFCAQITFLIAALSSIQNKPILAKNQLCKSIHEQPSNSELWHLLSFYLLIQHKSFKEAAVSALIAQELNKLSGKQYFGHLRMDIDDECLVCFSSLLLGNIDESLRNSQKAVHSNPGHSANWCGLLATATAVNCSKKKFTFSWLQKSFAITEELIKSSSYYRPILLWIKWNRILLGIIDKDLNLAKQFNKEILMITEKDGYIAKTSDLLSIIIDCMENKEKNPQASLELLKQQMIKYHEFEFGWQFLVKSYWAMKQYSEADKTICRWIKTLQQPLNKGPVAAIPYLYLAKSFLQNQITEDKKILLLDCLNKLEELKSLNKNVYFIRALLGFHHDDLKMTVTNLQNILKYFPDEDTWVKSVAQENLLALY